MTQSETSQPLDSNQTITSTVSLNAKSALDLTTVMKASQAIASEIVFDNLLKKLMHIVIENVGAQEGWLILKREEQLFIEAYSTLSQELVFVSKPLESVHEEQLARSIVTYTARKQTPLVLNDACHSHLFANDAYILQKQPLSVLCFPIIHKNQLMGLFYLENNLTTDAFTSDRLTLLNLLSTQIAISLENAQMIATLDAKVAARTTQLKAKLEELTQTRHELIQSEKMASLGRLVAGFAHEINTPIGVAVGAASTLQENVNEIHQLLQEEEVEEDQLVSLLDNVNDAAHLTLSNLRRAAGLVTSFKRTAIDQSSDETRHFHVKATIQDVINTLHNQFKKTAIKIQVDCPDDLAVYSLPSALEQILTNLMMNSLLHGFKQGQLTGQIVITVYLEVDQLHLKYSDTGQGMDFSTQEKIFEPFFTTARAQGGSGLGLYICYNLITNRLHGQITCESTPGQGISFHIQYPIQKNPAT